ncbi:Hypothetical_protein [Hexamita inflata]|uniref:Hypothetical_protein n=1 Tax=Hexamita inflata TaxID=28002 RepID=A0AA86PPX6_9EUKA|nr:Hypothetical protein HINF_LOCUS26602 [Hexamita inflata]
MSGNRTAAATAQHQLNQQMFLMRFKKMQEIRRLKQIERRQFKLKLQREVLEAQKAQAQGGFGQIMENILVRYQYLKLTGKRKKLDKEEEQFWIVKIKSPHVYQMLRNQLQLPHPKTMSRKKYEQKQNIEQLHIISYIKQMAFSQYLFW